MMKAMILFPLFLVMQANAQDFYDLETIQTIEINFEESNWDQLLDAQKAGDQDYILAQSVTINGVQYDSVGVKYKGNSSYNANQVKNPWHIELDTYKDHEYDGYTDIKLANGTNDPSFLRDVLGFQILRQYSDAPLSNYANLYVNGTLIGLYTNTESISKKFVNSRFGSKRNAFFDCSPPDGANQNTTDLPNLVFLGQDSSAYYGAYDIKSDAGWQELIDLCDTLANEVANIEGILDVDRALWMLAFDNVIVNLDSYIGQFSQNYYLYRDDYGIFKPIAWDLNESFGVFSQTGSSNLNSTSSKQQMTHLLHESDADFPLVQKLLSIPRYKRMYLAHYKTILLENFDNGSYMASAMTLQDVIDADVQADPNKFYSYNDFLNNVDTDVNSGGMGGGMGGRTIPGLSNLMDGRSSYILGLSDFTKVSPTISGITLSDSLPEIGQNINITVSIANGESVYFNYRDKDLAPFTQLQMYDDGLHSDGVAGDGQYGVSVAVNSSLMEYFFYAENSDAGVFYPARAAYEYYALTTSTGVVPGDLVINEFMASNDTSAADQDGDSDDWIEFYNNSAEPIDLSGYYLSDDGTDLMQWPFPVGTTISANGYLIVWADEDEDQVGLHANFKLSASGETIYLVDSSGVIVDEVTYGDQETDISYGRSPNGTGDFQAMDPTFGAANDVTTSISDFVFNAHDLQATPNPSFGSFELRIDGDSAPERTVYVYDLRGQLIYQNTITRSQRIETAGWTPGLYMARVENSFVKIAVQ